jgi:membrane associated rhomboid family serine protease
VAHFAHLSGLVVGAILVYFWKKNRNSFYWYVFKLLG